MRIELIKAGNDRRKLLATISPNVILRISILIFTMSCQPMDNAQSQTRACVNLRFRESELRNHGMEAKRSWEGYLSEGNSKTDQITTGDFTMYALAGASDDAANDLDIKIFDERRKLVSRDELADNTPLAVFEGRKAQKFYIEITMAKGSGYYCVKAFKANDFSEGNQSLLYYLKQTHRLKNEYPLMPMLPRPWQGWLSKGQWHNYPIELEAGKPYAIIAAGSLSSQNLNVFLLDSFNRHVTVVDLGRTKYFQPTLSGRHTIQVVMSGMLPNAYGASYAMGVYHLASQNAFVRNIRTQHNIFQNNQNGMRIFVDLEVKNHQNEALSVAAHFYWKSGIALRDDNNFYKTVAGTVATSQYLQPRNNFERFNNVVLFIPYDELHIKRPGLHELKFRVALHSMKTNAVLAESNDVFFNYTHNFMSNDER
jgi:hypothetical protein